MHAKRPRRLKVFGLFVPPATGYFTTRKLRLTAIEKQGLVNDAVARSQALPDWNNHNV